jgi:hypothetical protein
LEENAAVTWALPIPRQHGYETNLVGMFGYARGEYLMAKATPFPEVVDNEDKRHTSS